MSKILFATWSGGGNLAPALGIARVLDNRGHQVSFIGHAEQADAIKGRGFDFRPYEHAGAYSGEEPLPVMDRASRHMGVFTDQRLGDEVAAVADQESFDLVVTDHLVWGAHRAAIEHRIAFATLFHKLFGQQRLSWTEGPGAGVARSLGYEPLDLWAQSQVTTVTVLPELDPASGEDLPGNLVYVGPVWQGVPSPATTESEPLVVVSLSTIGSDVQQDLLQRILDALAALPVRTIATTGPAIDMSRLRVPENARVVTYAPHEELFARASLVVSHAGHSTAMAALARDIPLLLIPVFPVGDQPVVARLLADHGAAIDLSCESGVAEIARAAESLLHEPRYREAAAALGALIRRRDGAEAAADALTEVLARR